MKRVNDNVVNKIETRYGDTNDQVSDIANIAEAKEIGHQRLL
jgi:hypothetical protein